MHKSVRRLAEGRYNNVETYDSMFCSNFGMAYFGNKRYGSTNDLVFFPKNLSPPRRSNTCFSITGLDQDKMLSKRNRLHQERAVNFYLGVNSDSIMPTGYRLMSTVSSSSNTEEAGLPNLASKGQNKSRRKAKSSTASAINHRNPGFYTKLPNDNKTAYSSITHSYPHQLSRTFTTLASAKNSARPELTDAYRYESVNKAMRLCSSPSPTAQDVFITSASENSSPRLLVTGNTVQTDTKTENKQTLEEEYIQLKSHLSQNQSAPLLPRHTFITSPTPDKENNSTDLQSYQRWKTFIQENPTEAPNRKNGYTLQPSPWKLQQERNLNKEKQKLNENIPTATERKELLKSFFQPWEHKYSSPKKDESTPLLKTALNRHLTCNKKSCTNIKLLTSETNIPDHESKLLNSSSSPLTRENTDYTKYSRLSQSPVLKYKTRRSKTAHTQKRKSIDSK